MNAGDRRRDALCALVVFAGAAYFAVGVLWVRSHNPDAVGSNDTYTYVYPSFLYALRSLRDGAGFFWNPYQDCGQPFFAMSPTTLLYPVNWVAAVVAREPALIITIIVNLFIGGVGTYRLGRLLQLSWPAALCAALAFELGGAAMDMAAWSPVHNASFAWLPMAMWLTERMIQAPDARRAIALAGALAVQLLPGFHQMVFFTYQLIALRVAWTLLLRQTPHRAHLIRSTAAALVLPVGLAALQLVPSLEVARESLRTIPLSADELGGFHFSWNGLRVLGSVDLLGLALALTALAGCRTVARSTVIFHVLVGMLYFALTFGPGTPLFDIYAHLPMGTAFRGSPRFLWVVAFAIAILTGCGMQAILDLRGRGLRHAWVVFVPFVVAAPLLHWAMPEGLGTLEWILAAALIASAAVNATGVRTPVQVLLPLMVVVHGMAIVPKPFNGLRAGDIYDGNAEAFRLVQQRLTGQERVMIIGRPGDYALMPKSAMLFSLPDVFDYEPQVSRSYAELFTYMRMGRGMERLDDWYWIFRRLLPDTVQPRLFDLLATRYLLVGHKADRLPPVLAPQLALVAEQGEVRIYENRAALPRAFYVPRIVIEAPEKILPALATGALDPRRAAAVSQPPRSGFLGADPDGSGTVEIVDNGSERVALRVRATAPGFLFLADQFYPGWRARVNGEERELLRADYAFRLVEVPSGDSEVVFEYRPASVWLGGVISLATIAAVVVIWPRTRMRAPA